MFDLEERLKVFWASSPKKFHRVFVISIFHSLMSKTYYLWREPYSSPVTIPDVGVVSPTPANIDATVSGSETDLDQKVDINIDTTYSLAILRSELDRIPLGADNIAIGYYEYLSDDLINCLSRADLQCESISFMRGTATMTAISPRLNKTRTGSVYSPKDFPTLRGFL